MSEPEDDFTTPMTSIGFESGSTWAMKLTLSELGGRYLWTSLTAELWDQVKAAGDEAMAATLRTSEEENPGTQPPT